MFPRWEVSAWIPKYIHSTKVIYKEVVQGTIFMEQNMRFGLILGRLAIRTEKKFWPDYEQLLRAVFSCFQGQKKT